jgi:hypothetical protein
MVVRLSALSTNLPLSQGRFPILTSVSGRLHLSAISIFKMYFKIYSHPNNNREYDKSVNEVYRKNIFFQDTILK